MQLPCWGAHKAEDDVQVVDHQVQYHVHIQGAAVEDAETVSFEKHRPTDQALSRDDCGVKALQEAHLEDSPGGGCLPDQGIGFPEGHSDRLFQQAIESLS